MSQSGGAYSAAVLLAMEIDDELVSLGGGNYPPNSHRRDKIVRIFQTLDINTDSLKALPDAEAFLEKNLCPEKGRSKGDLAPVTAKNVIRLLLARLADRRGEPQQAASRLDPRQMEQEREHVGQQRLTPGMASAHAEEINVRLQREKLARERAELEDFQEKVKQMEMEQNKKEEELRLRERELEDMARNAREMEANVKDRQEKLDKEESERRARAEREHRAMNDQLRQRLQAFDDERQQEKREFHEQIREERARLASEKDSLLEQCRELERRERRKGRELEKREEEGPDARARQHVEECSKCSIYKNAKSAFDSLGLDERLFDRLYDRCYCSACYPDGFPDMIKNDGPKAYVVPRGWVRFGLKVPAQAHAQDVWEKWCVAFHGTRHDVAKAILQVGDLLMPGDKLPDGRTLGSANCAGRTDKMIYTSPTMKYAGLAFYAQPDDGPRRGSRFQVALQCRQKPGTFRVQAETMEFCRKGQRDLCPHVSCNEIEWVSDARKAIIPYGLLVRAYERGQPPHHFASPVDGGRFRDG